MIYDTFIFNHELDVLDIRMRYLWDAVDRFVIVEGDHTFHEGRPKAMHFADNRKRFDWAEEKIIYTPVKLRSDTGFWENQTLQRDAIAQGVRESKQNDMIIMSDTDQIPSVESVKAALQTLKKYKLVWNVQKLYFFYVNMLLTGKNSHWNGSAFFKKSFLKERTPNRVRKLQTGRGKVRPGFGTVVGGWHLTYQGGIEGVKTKLSHNDSAGRSGFYKKWTDDDIREILRNPYRFLDLQAKGDPKRQRMQAAWKFKVSAVPECILDKERFGHMIWKGGDL